VFERGWDLKGWVFFLNGQGFVVERGSAVEWAPVCFEREGVIEKAAAVFEQLWVGALGRRGSQHGGGGATLTWQPRWWRCTTMGGTVLTWQPKRGRCTTTGSSVTWHVMGLQTGDEGWWGADPGYYSPGGTPFPLLLAVRLVVAQSVVVVVVESDVHGQNALAC